VTLKVQDRTGNRVFDQHSPEGERNDHRIPHPGHPLKARRRGADRTDRPVHQAGVAPPDDIHQVHNTGDTVAITLHVYGADLSQGTSVRRTYQLRTTPQEST
jgi:predicted metal-dependent enzyme (double-stranded beta helix superfamily)